MKTKQYKKIKRNLKLVKNILNNMVYEQFLKQEHEHEQKEAPYLNFCNTLQGLEIVLNEWHLFEEFYKKFPSISKVILKIYLERWATENGYTFEQKKQVASIETQKFVLLHFKISNC